jgi:hypothetical protein
MPVKFYKLQYPAIKGTDNKKIAANIIKPMQTRNYLKKYVNGSVNSEGHLKIKIKKPGATLIQA